ncbi:MAG: hypothetical protein DRN04_05595 [Thermoprotei archaeon]|mgnify:CR=1 FL=1|nr:MAG: hypothetical protein DRN04_05595 [Thermoprotei archaeon]
MELVWKNVVKNRSWEDLRQALKIVLEERKKCRLKGSKRSVSDDVKLAELAALVVEELLEKEYVVLKTIDNNRFELTWNLNKFNKV